MIDISMAGLNSRAERALRNSSPGDQGLSLLALSGANGTILSRHMVFIVALCLVCQLGNCVV